MNVSQLKLRSEILEYNKAIMLWNQQVRTDRTVPNNKPDVIIRDNKKEHNVNRC